MSESFHEHLRLCLLRFLEGAPGYCANSSILHTEVQRFGLAASRAQVRSELDWLAEQNLVQIERLPGDLVVARLTERGLDVSQARALCSGVQRPAPRI